MEKLLGERDEGDGFAEVETLFEAIETLAVRIKAVQFHISILFTLHTGVHRSYKVVLSSRLEHGRRSWNGGGTADPEGPDSTGLVS